jgi:5-methyltetrahydrofolate--homocysteine methyltransferase
MPANLKVSLNVYGGISTQLRCREKRLAAKDSPHIRDLFHQKYRGSRYSFGYPACPNLEDQTKLFTLLKPEENVGVRLTSGFLLESEQSTSAIVVHHPAAKYFVV